MQSRKWLLRHRGSFIYVYGMKIDNPSGVKTKNRFFFFFYYLVQQIFIFTTKIKTLAGFDLRIQWLKKKKATATSLIFWIFLELDKRGKSTLLDIKAAIFHARTCFVVKKNWNFLHFRHATAWPILNIFFSLYNRIILCTHIYIIFMYRICV